MKAILALTKEGLKIALKVLESWENWSDTRPSLYLHQSLAEIDIEYDTEGLGEESKVNITYFSKLKEIIPTLWECSSLLVCIMATGIVVRQISPFLKGKDQDPAVLVLDEKGTFVISLLSGHLGGANAWTKNISQSIGATPVITTATDIQGLKAPDEYAREFGWGVEPLEKLRTVNRFLLDKGNLTAWSDNLPENHPIRLDPHYRFVGNDEKEQAQIWITDPKNHEGFFEQDIDSNNPPLLLIPKVYALGISCRKDTPKEQILIAIEEGLKKAGVSPKAIQGIFCIDIKAHEQGIIEAARSLSIPFKTFSAEEIQMVNDTRSLSASNFVKEKIGVNGVCEAASLLGTKEGELILPKQINKGVTVAISKGKSM